MFVVLIEAKVSNKFKNKQSSEAIIFTSFSRKENNYRVWLLNQQYQFIWIKSLKMFISTLALHFKKFFPILAAVSASPTSIIGYSTSSNSISLQPLWDTQSLQLKIQSTIKGDSLSSSIYPFTTGKDYVLTFSFLDFTGETEEASSKDRRKATLRKPRKFKEKTAKGRPKP